MSNTCLLCNEHVPFIERNLDYVLDVVHNQNVATLSETLTDVLEKSITENDVQENVVCKVCRTKCTEYASTKSRLQEIKSSLLLQYNQTLKLKEIIIDSPSVTQTKSIGNASPLKRVVLPASKLQPLPPNYVINVGKVAGLGSRLSIPRISSISTSQPTINLKVTVGSDVLTQSIKTGAVKTLSANTVIQNAVTVQSSPTKTTSELQVNTMNTISTSAANTLARILNTRGSLSLNLNTLPKDFLVTEDMKKEFNEENNDEQPMEIDEDCTLVRVTKDNLASEEDAKQESVDNSEYYELPLMTDEDGQDELVLRELRVLAEDEDEDQETIVMSGSAEDILRVVSRQKLVYAGGTLAILDNTDADALDHSLATQADDTGNESNDDSQIELQVSGDEETANAIIAAAQEQGGAFIKVESGEMFRVKSIQSKGGGAMKEEFDEDQIVAKDGDVFRCLLCEREGVSTCVSDEVRMCVHLRAAHRRRARVCPHCARVDGDEARYRRHLESHAEDHKKNPTTPVPKIYECDICQKRYSSRAQLSAHANTHSGARPFSCARCGKTFASKYTHQAHLKTHADRPRPHKCTECSKCFLTLQNLKQHEKTHSGVKEFICKTCGKAFGTQHNLEVHGVVHSGSKPFQCTTCSKGFARRAELRDHVRTHTGERPFGCPLCGARFAQRSNLHSHTRATHHAHAPHHCTLCNKKFKRRRLLEYHIKAMHTGERSLVCGICNSTFVYPEHYKKHLRIHSGERPFVCEVCGKSFNSRDNRNTHRFVHSDKKPYECLVCAAGFMRKQLLYAHMNACGHLAESIVVNQPRVQKVTESVITTQETPMIEIKGNKLGVIFESAPDIDLSMEDDKAVSLREDDGPKLFITDDKKLMLQDGKSVINITTQDDGEDADLLTLQNLDGSKTDMSALLQGITVDQLSDQTQMLATDEGGGVVKLVQVHLDNGTTGWMALNE